MPVLANPKASLLWQWQGSTGWLYYTAVLMNIKLKAIISQQFSFWNYIGLINDTICMHHNYFVLLAKIWTLLWGDVRGASRTWNVFVNQHTHKKRKKFQTQITSLRWVRSYCSTHRFRNWSQRESFTQSHSTVHRSGHPKHLFVIFV